MPPSMHAFRGCQVHNLRHSTLATIRCHRHAPLTLRIPQGIRHDALPSSEVCTAAAADKDRVIAIITLKELLPAGTTLLERNFWWRHLTKAATFNASPSFAVRNIWADPWRTPRNILKRRRQLKFNVRMPLQRIWLILLGTAVDEPSFPVSIVAPSDAEG